MNFDVGIVGAGPSGSMAAKLLAARGLHVLLVDKANFPRTKVCGCCINPCAQAALARAGCPSLLADLGARHVDSVVFALKHRRASLPVPRIYAVTRSRFDAALVDSAIQQGVQFLPNTHAELGNIEGGLRTLHLRDTHGNDQSIKVSVVLAADGIAGDLLKRQPDAQAIVSNRSRIGVGVTLEDSEASYREGTIYMACGPRGYSGIVRTEGSSLDIAAAIDAQFIKAAGGPGRAVSQMLDDSRLPNVPGLANASWRGTPPLTRRRRRMALERVFVIGDSAAYVEPFTGDGIAWALWSAIAVVDLTVSATIGWTESMVNDWTSRYKQLLRSRQRVSRVVAALLRSETAMRWSLAALSMAPYLATPVVDFINHKPFERSAETALGRTKKAAAL